MPKCPLVESKVVELSAINPEMYARAYFRLIATSEILELHEIQKLPIEIKVKQLLSESSNSFKFRLIRNWDLTLI
jgi:hypothetical protein